ncbi:hypothetical protein Tco_0763212 [Tanacetum coccineum]
MARRANNCIVSITEPDYKNLNKNNIKDMYLLIVNNKVPDYVNTGLLWSLSVFIRSSVIWERVHDFQLRIESYQQKINLTAPTITFPGIEKYDVFSIVYEVVHGIIYTNIKKDKRVMRHSEIHKFCDATLRRTLEGLKSYNNDVKYGYVQKKLTNDEVEFLKLFEEEIEVRLNYRDQMRRWEMKAFNFHTFFTPGGNGVELVVSMESIRAISARFANTVKLHGVPVTVFSEDGLSTIATKLGTPLMLDSYTSDMCIQSWGRSSYVRAMIEVRANVELKDTIMVFGHVLDECPNNIDPNVVKNMKRPSQTLRGVLKDVEPTIEVSNSNPFDVLNSVENDVDLGTNGGSPNLTSRKANTSGFLSENVESSSTSNNFMVEKIDKIERLIIEGKVTLVNGEGKPLKKVDYLGDHDSGDEVASIDNDMENYLASKKDGCGQDIPDKIQDICDNFDITVRGQLYNIMFLKDQNTSETSSYWFRGSNSIVSCDAVPPTSSYEVIEDFWNEPFLPDITSLLDSELSTLHIHDDFLAPSSWQDMMMKDDFSWAKRSGVEPSANKDGIAPSVKVASGDNSSTQEENLVKAGNDNLHDVNVAKTPSNFTMNLKKGTSYANSFTGESTSEEGLSAIATKLGTRAFIEVRADVELKDNIMVAMPKLVGEGFYTYNVHDGCPKNIDSDVVKNMKKPSQTPSGVPVGPKVEFKPVKQVYRQVSKKNNVNTSGNKKKYVKPTIEVWRIRVVPNWILRLANDRDGWDKYLWDSYVWPTLYYQLRDANVRRWPSLYATEPTNEVDKKMYSIFEVTWAFKTWIVEVFRAGPNEYYTRHMRYLRVVAWSSNKKFCRHMLRDFLHGRVPVERLIPDEIEAESGWWVSRGAYFYGCVSEAERIPRHLNRQNHYEVPFELEDMSVGTGANKEPIIVDQHYGISDLSGFQSMQGGPSSFHMPANNSFFNMGTPQTPMPSQPGSSNWQSQMPSYTPTPNWQPPIPSHPGDAGLCDPNKLDRARREQRPSIYMQSPYTHLSPTTVLPKKRVDKTKKKCKNDNVSH